MKISLRWKILAWFFVNLAVIGGGLFIFLRAQFHGGMHALLAGPTNERLEAIGEALVPELRTASAAQLPEVLARATDAWRARGVKAVLFRNDGSFAAGDLSSVPAEIARALQQYDGRKRMNFGPGGSRRMPMPQRNDGQRPEMPSRTPGENPGNDFMDRGPGGPGRGDGPRSMNGPGGPGGSGPGGPGGPRDGFRGGGGPPFMDMPMPSPSSMMAPGKTPQNMPATFEKFMLIAGDPKMYWAGVHLDSRAGDSPLPYTLLLASDSMRGGGLFFDYLPWLWVGGGLVLVSVLLWLPFVHHLTSAMRRLTQNAEQIAQGRFEPPPEMARGDELGRLNRAHREMAQRLDGFVTGQKRFLGDTAHELLSPLARLELAISILEQRTDDAGRQYTERALGEVRHISALVHNLLSFTKAGMHSPAAALNPVQLLPLTKEVLEREASELGVDVDVPAGLYVLAERELLSRALGNVVRNAMRYAGDAGPIRIHAESLDASRISLVVTDSGPGVPEDALSRLFDPFYRPDTARSQETGGTGLGLAIVKSCVEACGGTVFVRNCVPHGLAIEFHLRATESIS